MGTYTSERATLLADQIIWYGQRFAMYLPLIENRLRILDEAGKLDELAGIIDDHLINLTVAQPGEEEIVPLCSFLLYRMEPAALVPLFPELMGIFTAISEAVFEAPSKAFNLSSLTGIGNFVADILTYDGFEGLVNELGEAKLVALIRTLIAHDATGSSAHFTATRHKLITVMTPYFNINTEVDIAALKKSPLGITFRENYVKQSFPEPTEGTNYRYYLTDGIIEQLADIHRNADDRDSAMAILSLNRFLNNQRTLDEVEEILAYQSLLRGVGANTYTSVFDSMRLTPAFPTSHNYSLVDGTVRKQCEAFILVMSALNQNASTHIPGVEYMNGATISGWTLSDTRLVEFLMEHPERALGIVTFMKERGTLDWDALSTSLEVAHAISDGAL